MTPNSRPSTPSHSLDARLVLYTTAGAALLVTSSAEAQTIIYSGVRNVSGSAGGSATVDLDGNSTTEFSIATFPGSNPRSVKLTTVAAGFRAVGTGNFWTPLNSGVNISSSSTPFGTGTKYLAKAPHPSTGSGGPWPHGADRFLGLEFKIGASTHYGWARVRSTADATETSFNVTDWAYNATAGESILTGQTEGTPTGPSPSPVPEPSSLALFAGGTAALGLLRRRRTVA